MSFRKQFRSSDLFSAEHDRPENEEVVFPVDFLKHIFNLSKRKVLSTKQKREEVKGQKKKNTHKTNKKKILHSSYHIRIYKNVFYMYA